MSFTETTVRAENAANGSHYVTADSKISVRMWRQIGTQVYLYIPAIAKIINVDLDYELVPTASANSKLSDTEVSIYDKQMESKFKKDYPKIPLTQQTTSCGAGYCSPPPTAPITREQATPSSKKQIRSDYKHQIDQLKLERKKLSDENAEIREKSQATEDKAERKELTAKIKANVQRRAQLSDEIKEISQKIRDLRVAPTA